MRVGVGSCILEFLPGRPPLGGQIQPVDRCPGDKGPAGGPFPAGSLFASCSSGIHQLQKANPPLPPSGGPKGILTRRNRWHRSDSIPAGPAARPSRC